MFTVACLVLVALGCIAIVRMLERERLLLRKLRGRGALDTTTALSVEGLSIDERDCLERLTAAGVVNIRDGRCYLVPAGVRDFRRKRTRLALSGALGALALAVLLARMILHR